MNNQYNGEERRHIRREDQQGRLAREISFSAGGVTTILRNLPLQEILTTLMVVGISLNSYMSWTHREEMRESKAEIIKVITEARIEQATALSGIARTEALLACMLSFPMERRPEIIDYCAQLVNAPFENPHRRTPKERK